MQGQSLATSELTASLRYWIAQLIEQGLDRTEATHALAVRCGIRLERLIALVEPVEGGEA
jgi:hypothetical protein